MKKKIEIICFLCLGLFAYSALAEEDQNIGWIGASGGSYSDTANWYNGVINGVFGTNYTSKLTLNVLCGNGFDFGDITFKHSGEVTFNFIGDNGDHVAYMTNNWSQTPSASKGSITIGSGTENQGLTVDLGGNEIDFYVPKPTVNFYSPIINGDLNVLNTGIGLKGRNGSFPVGTVVASNSWVTFGSENDSLVPEVRVDELELIGTELTIYGHKYNNSFIEKINTLIVSPAPELGNGSSAIKFMPRSKSPVLQIGKLVRKNNAIINLTNNNSYNVGTTDFAANSCNLLLDEVPEFPYDNGEVGTTTCPVYPWLVSNLNYFYTYHPTRGVRSLDLETEVRTYSESYTGELVASGENVYLAYNATICDFTAEENVVNSLMWDGAPNSKVYVTNGVLKVLSGGIVMNSNDNAVLNANIDFGGVTGYIIARNNKRNYLRGNIAGTNGVVFATTLSSQGPTKGNFYVEGTGTFTGDTYVQNAVIIQNEEFFPYGERTGDTYIDGHLRLWYNTIRLNGLYGNGVITYTNGDSAKVVVGYNNCDGDFGGRFYGNRLNVEKIGEGTQIVRGENTTSGTTTVSAGTLYYESNVAGPIVVSDGAAFGGAGTFTADGTAIEVQAGGTLIPMSCENDGVMTVANDISFGGANTLKLTAIPDATTPALNVGGSVIGADSEVDVVFEGEKPGIYTLVKAQTAIEPKFVSATPNFKVYTSEDGLTVYGEKLDMGTVVIIR